LASSILNQSAGFLFLYPQSSSTTTCSSCFCPCAPCGLFWSSYIVWLAFSCGRI